MQVQTQPHEIVGDNQNYLQHKKKMVALILISMMVMVIVLILEIILMKGMILMMMMMMRTWLAISRKASGSMVTPAPPPLKRHLPSSTSLPLD